MPSEPDDDGQDRGIVSGQPESEPRADHRVRSAWRSWLSALAADPEAAMAAALAYESMPPEARDAWLDALEADAPTLDVPPVALYAPLLAVESESEPRRRRIEAAIGTGAGSTFGGAKVEVRALRGVGEDGTHACVIVMPLYLRFVQVLTCRYVPARGFVAVCHDPLQHTDGVAFIGEVEGIPVEPTPLRLVVEELAYAILADKRAQRETPAALASIAHLFAPGVDEGQDVGSARR
jgi:hypothetical protein